MVNLKSVTKFNLLLTLLFVFIIFSSGIVLSAVLHTSAQAQLMSKAELLMQTMDSVRYYTDTQVNDMSTKIGETSEFLPQATGNYAAREVFEHLRTKKDYANFFYKEAALNPTNVARDKADYLEAGIIQSFRDDPNTKKVTGYRPTLSGELFYLAHPIIVTSNSCLKCHGKPDNAPRNMLVTYGRGHGFGWKLNEIVGAQIVFVPTSNQYSIPAILIIFGVFVLVACVVLRRILIKPLIRKSRDR